jgi:DnaJ-class molecular chaperone
MAYLACRYCDGRGRLLIKDGPLVTFSKNRCSRCGGNGIEPGISKGKRRFFTPKEEKDESEMSLEDQTRAFLAKHGY